MKKSRPKFHEEHDDHVDERWLVSYSDMMTLLFGLFVMLYSLAVEHKGNINPELKKIQASGAFSPRERDPAGRVSGPTNREDELTRKLEQSQLVINEMRENLEDLGRKLANEKSESQGAAPEPLAVDSKIESLRTQLNQKERELKETLNELVELKKREQEMKEANLDLEKKLEDERKLSEDLRAGAQAGDFLLIVLKWTTEKHDLDLSVKDPEGHTFNFKTRSYSKLPGELVVDSRSGPGVEVFQAASPMLGDYEIQVEFYNAYGNPQDAQAQLSILTKWGEKRIDAFTLGRNKDRSRLFKFHLKDRGEIEL